MARGGKIGNKRKTRNKVRLEKKGSDESDEDYKVDEDEEFDESEDDYCSSLAEDESEESLGELEEEEEEEEEWVEKKAKKVGKSRRGKGFQGRKKNGLVKPKIKRFSPNKKRMKFVDEKPRKRISGSQNRDKWGFSVKRILEIKIKCHIEKEKEDSEFDDPDDEDDEEFSPGEVLKRTRKEARRRKPNVNSDSDFISSGSSDYEYNISEEEREQVESRCPHPASKDIATISRTARANDGQDLKDAVFPVPERDQVYQPSEEELRGYLDPYENVLCTECQQGGDDAFMLLCDLCDSPAHTYCVGLGREVPDGNWYCDGCRPTALASSTAQALNPTSDHGATNNSSVGASPVAAVRETFDLNEVYVPDTPLTQVTGHSQSPRPSIGLQATSPASGSGAFTLFERRRIQRQIHQLLNNRSRQSDRSDGMAPASGINLFGSLIGRDMVAATQNTVMPARTAPENIHLQQRLPDYNMPSLYNREVFSPRLSSLRGEAFRNQASTSSDHSFAGLSQNQFAGINAGIGGGLVHQQLHPCGGPSNTGPDANTSVYQFREVSYFSYKRSSAVNGQKSF
ncbi:UNVERIFIED_CONTAM: hypothetical protein Sangu_0581400 [Sesamum angustifolium]|uniref:PHD-type domain-containing protein n=1 Tax=Sesamum angustifolium TaxID=2727405 RepID=A0AAW2QBZ0_9LAMI